MISIWKFAYFCCVGLLGVSFAQDLGHVISRKVLISHDGGLDDYVGLAFCFVKENQKKHEWIKSLYSTFFFQTQEDVEIVAIVVTNADGFAEDAASASSKIANRFSNQDFPIATSDVRALNPFPTDWRIGSIQVDHLPILNEIENNRKWTIDNGVDVMIEALMKSTEPIEVLEFGPLSTIAAALKKNPDIASKISRIVWMGGAFNVSGNVHPDRGNSIKSRY